jgi:hypothetical protein
MFRHGKSGATVGGATALRRRVWAASAGLEGNSGWGRLPRSRLDVEGEAILVLHIGRSNLPARRWSLPRTPAAFLVPRRRAGLFPNLACICQAGDFDQELFCEQSVLRSGRCPVGCPSPERQRGTAPSVAGASGSDELLPKCYGLRTTDLASTFSLFLSPFALVI